MTYLVKANILFDEWTIYKNKMVNIGKIEYGYRTLNFRSLTGCIENKEKDLESVLNPRDMFTALDITNGF